jgi:hypothetical protein
MKNNSIFIVAVLGMMLAIGVQSCKKERCWECVKNSGQVDEVKWNVCGEKSDKENAENRGYSCREVD